MYHSQDDTWKTDGMEQQTGERRGLLLRQTGTKAFTWRSTFLLHESPALFPSFCLAHHLSINLVTLPSQGRCSLTVPRTFCCKSHEMWCILITHTHAHTCTHIHAHTHAHTLFFWNILNHHSFHAISPVNNIPFYL